MEDDKMKKFALMTAVALVFMSAECFAGVTFIVDSPQHASRSSGNSGNYNSSPSFPTITPPSSESICRSKGYNKNSCPAGQYGVLPCEDDTSYYKYCCPNENRYTPSECEAQGKRAVGGGCHGLYACQE